MLLSKVTYSEVIYLSVRVFPGNQTHNLCVAKKIKSTRSLNKINIYATIVMWSHTFSTSNASQNSFERNWITRDGS